MLSKGPAFTTICQGCGLALDPLALGYIVLVRCFTVA